MESVANLFLFLFPLEACLLGLDWLGKKSISKLVTIYKIKRGFLKTLFGIGYNDGIAVNNLMDSVREFWSQWIHFRK